MEKERERERGRNRGDRQKGREKTEGVGGGGGVATHAQSSIWHCQREVSKTWRKREKGGGRKREKGREKGRGRKNGREREGETGGQTEKKRGGGERERFRAMAVWHSHPFDTVKVKSQRLRNRKGDRQKEREIKMFLKIKGGGG